MGSFGDKRWQLHTALAWVITRDRQLTENAKPNQYNPALSTDRFFRDSKEDRAWRLLHESMASGRVPTFTVLDGRSAKEITVSPSSIAKVDWSCWGAGPPWLKGPKDAVISNVTLSSSGLLHEFAPGSRAISHTSDDYGPPLDPHAAGYMPLSEAAYWVATEGGKKRVVIDDADTWAAAFTLLMPFLASGEIEAIGRARGEGVAVVIPSPTFSGLPIDYPYSDRADMEMYSGERPYIECTAISQSMHMWADHNDKIWHQGRRSIPLYTHIELKRSDIAKCLPFGASKSKQESKRTNRGGGIQNDLADAFRKVFGSDETPPRDKLRFDDLSKRVIDAMENNKTASRNTILKAENAHNERAKLQKKSA